MRKGEMGEWKVLLGFEKVLGGMGVYFFDGGRCIQ